jgi:hypothetical protein
MQHHLPLELELEPQQWRLQQQAGAVAAGAAAGAVAAGAAAGAVAAAVQELELEPPRCSSRRRDAGVVAAAVLELELEPPPPC